MGGNACLFIVIHHVCLLLVDQGFLGLSWLPIWGAQALRWSLKPTFSFIFSIFFTELRLWWRSSSRRWKTGSPDLPICFSSCFSASFSLLSALMLSAWYMWYVFITWEKWPRLLGDVCLQRSQWTGLLWGVHVKNTTFQLARGKSDGSKTGEFWLLLLYKPNKYANSPDGRRRSGDRLWWKTIYRGLRTFSICAKFSHAQKCAPQSPLSYELAAQAIYSWVSFSLTGAPH